MFFPYKDENPTRQFAVITLCLICINILVFLVQLLSSIGYENIILQFGMIPGEITSGNNMAGSDWLHPYTNVVTYMFIHGSISHLAFNMLFLWIFGNNIEDLMRGRFIIFYLITGILSGIAYVVPSPGSSTPLVGASGAISAVLGVYLIKYPFAKIRALIFFIVVRIPAIVFLPIWFAIQILGYLNSASGKGDNIAWISHIIGFISGIVLYKLFVPPNPTEGG